ncbi:hypothetical protein FIU83_14240 [Halomonas sp. THAF5a]|nr:hypothetical protein FIU83_14240 [Halomonas sp. THAF5a]
MHLLMLNGNTNAAMTDAMAARVRAFLGEAVEVEAETAERGVAHIGSPRKPLGTADRLPGGRPGPEPGVEAAGRRSRGGDLATLVGTPYPLIVYICCHS